MYRLCRFGVKNNSAKWIIVAEGDPSLCIGMVNYLMYHGYTVTGVGSAMRIITLSEPLFFFTVPANIKSGADLKLVKPVDFRLLAACVANIFSRLDS